MPGTSERDAPVADTHRPGYAAVIGDLVGSRQAAAGLFDHVTAALTRVNDRIEALQPLQITIGDEFQGVYRGLGAALDATLLVRLLLHGTADVRFGIGWGGFTRWNPDRAPFEQDGPAWWAAREALDAARAQESGAGLPVGWRTAVRFDPALPVPAAGAPPAADAATETRVPAAPRPLDLHLPSVLDAVVMFRDHLCARLDDRDVALVLAVLDGATVTDAAQQVGISQQAASRRLRTNGGYALLQSWRQFQEDT